MLDVNCFFVFLGKCMFSIFHLPMLLCPIQSTGRLIDIMFHLFRTIVQKQHCAQTRQKENVVGVVVVVVVVVVVEGGHE